MQKIEKIEKVEKKHKAAKVIALILDVVVYVYYSLNFYWMFGVADMETHPLTDLFTRINPMTIGVYIAGIAMLIHLLVFRNIFSRCVMCLPFLLSATISLVSLMGMTGWKDLIMFVPDVIILCLAVIIIVKQIYTYRAKSPTAQQVQCKE